MVGQFVGGTLFHRLGAKRLIVGALLVQGLIQLSIPLTNSWLVYIALMTGLGFTFNLSFPAIQAFIGFRWKEQRRELFNIVYVANNLGMAIGTSLAGVIATSCGEQERSMEVSILPPGSSATAERPQPATLQPAS
ncbi:MFS transporter [Brevibacillus agri]|uniref:MFS transporter n=1 Tax=Brevibacillus agri TaxID=51101 RepID=UPI0025B62D51|nr:MFS transporter [Brevibacillus agri]MDN4094917.1 MFS transporter [Brevibacillus agri]